MENRKWWHVDWRTALTIECSQAQSLKTRSKCQRSQPNFDDGPQTLLMYNPASSPSCAILAIGGT